MTGHDVVVPIDIAVREFFGTVILGHAFQPDLANPLGKRSTTELTNELREMRASYRPGLPA